MKISRLRFRALSIFFAGLLFGLLISVVMHVWIYQGNLLLIDDSFHLVGYAAENITPFELLAAPSESLVSDSGAIMYSNTSLEKDSYYFSQNIPMRVNAQVEIIQESKNEQLFFYVHMQVTALQEDFLQILHEYVKGSMQVIIKVISLSFERDLTVYDVCIGPFLENLDVQNARLNMESLLFSKSKIFSPHL